MGHVTIQLSKCERMSIPTNPKKLLLKFMFLFLFSRNGFSIGSDTLAINQSLSVSQTLVSQRSIFELGFFKPGTSLKVYLGIWYKNFDEKIFVWEANRDRPSYDPSSTRLELSAEGNLVLLANTTNPIWSADLTSQQVTNSTEAVLLDSGNFVIRDGSNPTTIYWQSFDYPTDTYLPGAKLGYDKRRGLRQQLVSWRSTEDPAPGMYSLGLDPNNSLQFISVWNKSSSYWRSGEWEGQRFVLVPEMRLGSVFNYSFVSNEDESYFTYNLYNNSTLSRLVLDVSGQLQQLSWLGKDGHWDWFQYWAAPRMQSDIYAFCGAFGVYNETGFCECLPGFTKNASNDWSSDGCAREVPLACPITDGNGTQDGFIEMSNLTFPSNPIAHQAATAAACGLKCRENCSCTAYSYNGSGCFVWKEDLLNLQKTLPGGGSIYIRLAASALEYLENSTKQEKSSSQTGKRTTLWVVPVVVVPIAVLLFGLPIYYFMRKGKQKHNVEGIEKMSKDLLLFNFFSGHDSNGNEIDNQEKGGSECIELPSFSYESVGTSTSDFSDANKLGEGGYGPVYKGKLLNGQEIAVKRLSKRSGQGLAEFRNEAILIAKLQHRNLVRLLGCCIEQDEKILIYEYMPNKSLDFFLFDATKKEVLDWSSRIHIIEGIAQGLLYLHQYSRLRIIHRDLKPSNILLDSEMNPKISDFGMARIFGGNEAQANTNRIVGTYGYMSPEYAIEGLFSVKSDVFSFGVLLLEIVSGRRNTSFYDSESLNLLGYAWKLWNSDQSLELVDQVFEHHPSSCSMLRYINIGLLCVQENPNDRPTMAAVVKMIINEQASLPRPKQPAFIACRHMTDTSFSENSVTVSTLEAR